MIHKRIDQITVDDIQGLVDNSVREGKSVEYKEQLPGNGDSDKKEFLADASSFANASGGDIIFGIRETRDSAGKPTGIPASIVGLQNINADAEVRRMEQILRDGIEPRLPGIVLRAIDGFANGPVILLRIPQSWASPHMVSFKASPRFFSRTSAGKSPLGIPEIRAAFVQSDSLPQRIKAFRQERIGLILAGETPASLIDSPLVVLHLIPVSAFLNATAFDLQSIIDGRVQIPNIGGLGAYGRPNVDGFVSYSGGQSSQSEQFSYTQVFRNGCIEAADALVLSGQDNYNDIIPSTSIETEILKGATYLLKVYQSLGIDSPLVVMLSLLNVRGFYMYTGRHMSPRAIHRIERRDLILPDVIIEDLALDARQSFRPVFDLLWQACGYRQSLNYDEQGRWNPNR